MAGGHVGRAIVTPTLDGRGRLRFPRAARYVQPLLAAVVVTVTIRQSDDVGPAQLAFGALVVVPWIVAAALDHPALPVRVVLYGAFYAGVLGFLTDATDYYYLPLVLVFITFDIALMRATLESATIATCSVMVMIGSEIGGLSDDAVPWTAGIGLAWLSGAGVRSMIHAMQELRVAEAELAAQTLAEDRRRVAREVHDVVAHSLSITMLHVTGAREALEHGGDLDDAVQGLRDAERIGRQSLADVRRTVGLLDGGHVGDTRPEPGAADIAGLVGDLTAAGVDVSYETSGDLDAITDTTGLGLYRIAQESLANASRHASEAPIEVTLGTDGGLARLRIANPLANGHSPLDGVEGGGSGLEGMRRRAQTLGGSLRAGPEDSMWIVEVDVPLATEAT